MTDDIDIAQLRAEADYVLCKYSKADGDTVVVEDKPSTRLARGVLSVLDALEHARKERDAANFTIESITAPHCEGCGSEVDPTTCWCGSECGGRDGHPFVEMGCNCMRDKNSEEWQRIAANLRVLVWQAKTERDALRQQLEAVTRERDVAMEHVAKCPPFKLATAGALADEVSALVRRSVVDARDPVADALLDYRNPPSTERADRIAQLTRELEQAVSHKVALNEMVGEVTRERDEARAQLDAMRIPISGACVGHSELNGYIDTAEQCRDWLTSESANENSGKMEDFAEALDVVVDQVEKQRRRANWYEAAYEAGKTKLIEAALAKQAEAIAAFLLSPELANTAGVDLTNPDCPIGATLTDAANEIRTGAWRSR